MRLQLVSACVLLCVLSTSLRAQPVESSNKDSQPRIELLKPGVKLTLLAEQPALVTPTGIDIDDQGQIWLAACHTHFRPKDYQGPEHDEILVFSADGKNRRVFYNKTDATMHVEVGPNGWIYLAERDRILRVKDTDGDGLGDLEENLAVLDTLADYPHNGLSGMAWHPDGALVFSLGENFGKDWTLTARDGSKLQGRGEGGVFRCTSDGKQLSRIARGFWNPFGLLVRDNGEIFAAENDPGSRPPCRLLHVVQDADYGFQWVYGSAPVHPFVAWNGELRGTLGMVHPCGEGPCAVVELGGGLLIPSWSDHCIDYYPLHREGATYKSERVPVLKGTDNFRPVCMVNAGRGIYYFTDWVDSSYEVHGKGRLWKLEVDAKQSPWVMESPPAENDASLLASQLRDGKKTLPLSELLPLTESKDTYLADAALTAIARVGRSWTIDDLLQLTGKQRLMSLVALRRNGLAEPKWVRALWDDRDPEVRFECLRWIADGVLGEFRPEVEGMLAESNWEFRLFEAALATHNTLIGNPGAGVTDDKMLAERLLHESTSLQQRAYLLRLVSPRNEKVTVEFLKANFRKGNQALDEEIVLTLTLRSTADAFELLIAAATDQSLARDIRLDAIAALSRSSEPEHQNLLVALCADKDAAIRKQAARSLRLQSVSDTLKQKLSSLATTFPDIGDSIDALNNPTQVERERPILSDASAWLKLLNSTPGEADPDAGRRLFFTSRLAACANCHRHQGRGNVVGPDLSFVSQQGDELSLLRSILEPNREVAPQFYASAIELDDGTLFTGILLRSSNTEVFRDSEGNEKSFNKSDIVQRKELRTSLMPTNLVSQLTNSEIRDLLAFLESGRPAFHPK